MNGLILAAVLACSSPEELELVRLVNEYRGQNGLPALPTSHWLASTARWKVWDRINNPSAVGGVCSSHSWSNSPPVGVFWSGVCYTMDHAQASQMYVKPRQISATVYSGNGFELTADAGGTQTAQQALDQWKNSPSHNTVILQQGPWSGVLQGVGTGIGASYAVMWFGDGVNAGGPALPCQTDAVFASGFE